MPVCTTGTMDTAHSMAPVPYPGAFLGVRDPEHDAVPTLRRPHDAVVHPKHVNSVGFRHLKVSQWDGLYGCRALRYRYPQTTCSWSHLWSIPDHSCTQNGWTSVNDDM